MRLLFAYVLLVWSASVGAQAQASFDCARARSQIEHAICATPDLARLDGELNRAYLRTRDLMSEHERQVLLGQQRAWVRSRDAVCVVQARVDTVCLKDIYRRRLAEFAGAAPAAARGDALAFEWSGTWRFGRPGFSGSMEIARVVTGMWRVSIQTSMSSGNFSTCDVAVEMQEIAGNLVGRDASAGTGITIERQGSALLVTQTSDGGACGLNATFEGLYRQAAR